MDDITYINTILPTLEGWCTKEKALTMYNCILELDKPLCVELGVFAGRSLVAICRAAKMKNGKVFGIDAWSKDASALGENTQENNDWWAKIDYDYFYNYTKNIIKESNVDDCCTILRNKTSDVVELFQDKSIDFLHQDGNHSEQVTIEEVNRWFNKVKIGGYWAFDDSDWPTTKAAQLLLVEKGYTLLSENDGKWQLYKRTS